MYILVVLLGIIILLEVIQMIKLTELAGVVTTLSEKVTKIAVEVQALKDALVNVEIPAEAQNALDALSTQLQSLDDVNPDA